MFRMAVGHSDDVDAEAAAEEVLEQCERALEGATPIAGLLLSAWETDHAALLSAVRKRHPGVELIGSSSAGEMTSVLGFQEDSVALALFASDAVEITAGVGLGVGADPEGAARRAVEQARTATTKEPRLCITMPSVGASDPAGVLGHLQRALGPGVAILGGGSAARATRTGLNDGFVFCNDEIVQDAVPVLLFSGALTFSYGIGIGWRPVGPTGIVSSASEGAVHRIDDDAAMRFYERYLGPGARPAFANPLAVFEAGSERFYLRAPIAHDASGSIGFTGSVPEQSTVRLTVATTDEVFEGTRSALATALQTFPEGSSPEAALVFSCAIRKLFLGTRTGTELKIAREVAGSDLPICGFYCFGEIAPLEDPGSPRFHNETIVAVLLGSE
jgi:hypothetical protein